MAKICFDVDLFKKFLESLNLNNINGFKYELTIENYFRISNKVYSNNLEFDILDDEIISKIDNLDKAKILIELDKIEKSIDKLKKKLDNSITFPDIKK